VIAVMRCVEQLHRDGYLLELKIETKDLPLNYLPYRVPRYKTYSTSGITKTGKLYLAELQRKKQG